MRVALAAALYVQPDILFLGRVVEIVRLFSLRCVSIVTLCEEAAGVNTLLLLMLLCLFIISFVFLS